MNDVALLGLVQYCPCSETNPTEFGPAKRTQCLNTRCAQHSALARQRSTKIDEEYPAELGGRIIGESTNGSLHEESNWRFQGTGVFRTRESYSP